MRKFDHMADVEVLVAIADCGTISAAAVLLATTPSVLSRAVARLEARLGVQLLRRTTRRLSMTDVGMDYVERMRAVFGTIADTERALQNQGGELTGRVMLSAPTTYAHFRLPPMLAEFSRLHPKVMIDLSIANRNVDLVSEGYDMAIRLGDLSDSRLVARTLEQAELCMVAAPAYIAQAGTPSCIEELAQHQCLPFVMPSTGRQAPWLLRERGQDLDWMAPSRIRIADDVLGVVQLAEAGAGICQTYRFVAEARLRSGALLEVLPGTGGRGRSFSLIYSPHRAMSPACRALIDSLVSAAAIA
ncbi:LysR family transcriptional regulator [Oxalobacteraceae bacterium]|nr:LysR family transcriptional regulator [Oxalobacteraceae bacterium]